VIEDLNSRNGTWVNGNRVSEATALNEGDQLRVGRFRMVVGQAAVPASHQPEVSDSGGQAVAGADDVGQEAAPGEESASEDQADIAAPAAAAPDEADGLADANDENGAGQAAAEADGDASGEPDDAVEQAAFDAISAESEAAPPAPDRVPAADAPAQDELSEAGDVSGARASSEPVSPESHAADSSPSPSELPSDSSAPAPAPDPEAEPAPETGPEPQSEPLSLADDSEGADADRPGAPQQSPEPQPPEPQREARSADVDGSVRSSDAGEAVGGAEPTETPHREEAPGAPEAPEVLAERGRTSEPAEPEPATPSDAAKDVEPGTPELPSNAPASNGPSDARYARFHAQAQVDIGGGDAQEQQGGEQEPPAIEESASAAADAGASAEAPIDADADIQANADADSDAPARADAESDADKQSMSADEDEPGPDELGGSGLDRALASILEDDDDTDESDEPGEFDDAQHPAGSNGSDAAQGVTGPAPVAQDESDAADHEAPGTAAGGDAHDERTSRDEGRLKDEQNDTADALSALEISEDVSDSGAEAAPDFEMDAHDSDQTSRSDSDSDSESESDSASGSGASEDTTPAKPRRRPRFGLLMLGAALMLLGAAGWIGWQRPAWASPVTAVWDSGAEAVHAAWVDAVPGAPADDVSKPAALSSADHDAPRDAASDRAAGADPQQEPAFGRSEASNRPAQRDAPDLAGDADKRSDAADVERAGIDAFGDGPRVRGRQVLVGRVVGPGAVESTFSTTAGSATNESPGADLRAAPMPDVSPGSRTPGDAEQPDDEPDRAVATGDGAARAGDANDAQPRTSSRTNEANTPDPSQADTGTPRRDTPGAHARSTGNPEPQNAAPSETGGPPTSIEETHDALARIEPIAWPGLTTLHQESSAGPDTGASNDNQTQPDESLGPPQRVAFLVDASGSAIDTLPQVIDWLNQRVQSLGPTQSFTVVFFRAGEAVEAPPVGLKRATAAKKLRVNDWLEDQRTKLVPQGKSDLGAALRHVRPYHPDALYVLCDGNVSIDGDDDPSATLATRAAALLNEPAPRVHTVQFFYRRGAKSLRSLAEHFGGQYTFVAPQQTADQGGPDWMRQLAPSR